MFACRIRNPPYDWKIQVLLQLQSLESRVPGIQNPLRVIQNPTLPQIPLPYDGRKFFIINFYAKPHYRVSSLCFSTIVCCIIFLTLTFGFDDNANRTKTDSLTSSRTPQCPLNTSFCSSPSKWQKNMQLLEMVHSKISCKYHI